VSDITERGNEPDTGVFPGMGDDISSWEGKTSARVSARIPTKKDTKKKVALCQKKPDTGYDVVFTGDGEILLVV
jgi:hypothetical protein